MEKRFQVFVSSTYNDLKEARQKVMLTLMKMNCIPAGMEHFPASDEEQWNFIKRIIDDSDYYLLIIGGRYGSLDSDGISFTEKEYDYAVTKNIKVIALIHGEPQNLSLQNSEQNPELRERLESFKNKVATKRLVEFWSNPSELDGKVALGIMNAMNVYPAVGWVRGNRISNEDSLHEINELRKENSKLSSQLSSVLSELDTPNNTPDNLSDFDAIYTFSYTGWVGPDHRRTKASWGATISWKEIFSYISPSLLSYRNEISVSSDICILASTKTNMQGETMKVTEQDLFTIGIQLQAYGLITIENLATKNGGMANFWKLTAKGKEIMIQLRTIKK